LRESTELAGAVEEEVWCWWRMSFLGGGESDGVEGWRVGGIWGVAVVEEGVLGGMMGGGWMGWDRELWVLVYENGGTSGEESRMMGLLT